MIYLQASVADTLEAGDKHAVLKSLQTAVELEHSTIPPYLYALYSIVPGANTKVAEIIKSVVIEEMLHLALASNVINALGGSPVLDKPHFIPRYPGPLPGSVEGSLIVPLAPCSIDVVTNVFMVIEEPEKELDFPVEVAADAVPPPLTIGMFYTRIKEKIAALGNSAFVPGPRHQITPEQMDNCVVVTNVDTACQAIDTIIDQGEGTRTSPLEVVGKDYAHYYRYAEISKGGLLVKNPDAGPGTPPDDRYFYDTVQNPVPFDPAGVYPVPTNPVYPPGSVGQVVNDNFNYTYTSLLKVLHRTLNGKPALLSTAIGMMESLRQQAMDMMSGTDSGGQNIGPSFQYTPVIRPVTVH